MMTTIFAHKALLPSGWADAVRLSVTGGIIQSVTAAAQPAAKDIQADCVIPGLCNAHSHAFQRALGGWTEQRSPAGQDNFWSWRERMYELAAHIDPLRLRVIARQVYIEMLTRGYTSVVEFHYLHRPAANGVPDDSMFEAVRDAAVESCIRVCYVPVLYERAGFDHSQAVGPQRLFALDLDVFLEHYYRTRDRCSDRLTVGIGAHSIRAVSESSLAKIASVANTANAPMHIHIAEQQAEVEQSLAAYDRRPAQWLLENFEVAPNWCLVHATHIDADETRQIAASGAVVCLCPSTEANLGDGIFPLQHFLRHGGQFAIGSDSHISINPFEELRWLEYGQRLTSRVRNVTALRHHHVGYELFERALEGGALAVGQTDTGLVAGGPADLVTLHGDDPMLAPHGDATRLDALVFSGYRLPIDAVMVGGDWCVRGGVHRDAAPARSDYNDAVRRIVEAFHP